MFRVLVVIALLAVSGVRSESGQVAEKSEKTARQKRLLFYDEEGNLVKTYKNPYLYDFAQNSEKFPFISPFFSFFRPSSFGATAYMIPVSDQVIQQFNKDPIYQTKLLTVPRKDLVIEPNTQCSGKRTQIPAKSCKNFLNCWDGWAFEQECPEGLLFSKDGYCDYPQNVDCSKRTNEPPAPAVTKPTSPQCSKDKESFRNEEQCSEFFICVDSTPVKFKCPADLLYNEELGVCDYAYRVDCKPSASPMKEPAQPIQPASPASPASPAAPNPPQPCASPSDGKDNEKQQSPANIVPGIRPVFVNPPVLSSPGISTNTIIDQQNWSSTHVAISRQDALRQLRIKANS